MFSSLLAIIYMSFISLGLPDSLLGAAWPSIQPEINVPVSYAGLISMIISLGTIGSSLLSDRLTKRMGTGRLTALSVAMTALALFGFSFSGSFLLLCLWAVPYGLGAGSVDASLNNYVALHYESKHMSWLHCMWGVGATLGPYIMGCAISVDQGWNMGFRIVGIIQLLLTAALILSLPMWKRRSEEDSAGQQKKTRPLSLREVICIPGTKAVMLSFLCYCGLEQTAGLWAASYFNLHEGVSAETAASFTSMFFLGITIGRGFCGFAAMKFNDRQMVRAGLFLLMLGILLLITPLGIYAGFAGLILIGLGCAPIYPCMIHSTPGRFGAEQSQTMIGLQMASAYIGTCALPPVFGLMAERLDIALMPWYLLMLLVVMALMLFSLDKKTPD